MLPTSPANAWFTGFCQRHQIAVSGTIQQVLELAYTELAPPAADRAVSETPMIVEIEYAQAHGWPAESLRRLESMAAAAKQRAAPPADRAELAEKAKRLADELAEQAWSAGDNGERLMIAPCRVAREKVKTAIDALARSTDAPSEPKRTYGLQYTPEQRAWCEKYERETTFEPLMCDFEAGNESFLHAAKNSRAWFESWSNDAYLRGCDDIPGEMEALHEEITGEKL